MDITPQDAFKLGFLTRCAEERLTGQALEDRLDKVAAFNKQAIGGLVKFSPADVSLPNATQIGKGVEALKGWTQAAYAIPLAAAIAAGGGVGYGAAKMVEPQVSEDELQAQELADTYRLYAAKAKARKKLRGYRAGYSGS
jgi:hypothetical protein